MTDSRNKGKRGELELADVVRELGFPARRGQQFKGGPGSPDVVIDGLEDVHVECKRTETVRLEAWIAQAVRDSGGKLPVVAHRKNRGEWLAILRLEDFLNLMMTVGKPSDD